MQRSTYQCLWTTLNKNLIGIVHHLGRELNDFIGECRREEQTLTGLGHLLLNQEGIGPMARFGNHVIGLI